MLDPFNRLHLLTQGQVNQDVSTGGRSSLKLVLPDSTVCVHTSRWNLHHSVTPRQMSLSSAKPRPQITTNVCTVGSGYDTNCNVVAPYSLCLSIALQALREKKIRQELLRQLNADGKEAQKAAEILASGPVAGVGLRDKA